MIVSPSEHRCLVLDVHDKTGSFTEGPLPFLDKAAADCLKLPLR